MSSPFTRLIDLFRASFERPAATEGALVQYAFARRPEGGWAGFAGSYLVYASEGELVAWGSQTSSVIGREMVLYRDPEREHPWMLIRRSGSLWLGGRYQILDATSGTCLARIGRGGLRLLRPDGSPWASFRDPSRAAVHILRTIFRGEPERYDLLDRRGKRLATLAREPAELREAGDPDAPIFSRPWVLSLFDELDEPDEGEEADAVELSAILIPMVVAAIVNRLRYCADA